MPRQIILTIVVSSLVSLGIIGTFLIIYSSEVRLVNGLAGEVKTEIIPETFSVDSNKELVAMIERVNPAVVSIVVTKDVPVYEQYYEEYNPWGIWGGFNIPKVREKGTEEQEVGGGSGFIVSEDGMVVTNRHVVEDDEAKYSVLLNDGKSYEVEIIERDPQLDIAILKILSDIPDTKFPNVPFGNSETLKLGEGVVAIGNALGEFRNSVSVGVVSGLARSITASDSLGRTEQLDQVIQTDAAINPGNSGGPLLNLQGEVIGVNVANTRGAENIGFALPAHVVNSVVQSVQEYGEIVRPYLGVRYMMVNERIKKINNLKVDYGALVVRGDTREELAVLPGSPASLAGIEENDIILKIDGEELREVELASVLRNKKVGDTIELLVLKDDKEETVYVKLMKTP
jgi:serine protease Do